MTVTPESGQPRGDGHTGPRPAEQDGEYLHDAHVIIAAALAEVLDDGDDQLDRATWVLDKLAEAGWWLVNAEDHEKLIDAYVMQAIR
jgi:hypothetical protein